ncbi:MAG TPA: polysaccharide biosynthesis/export family protein [Bryobacteraceae bacterium]|nr:polysaccharide biosynthesis/export family protein [Bryobacteraceae bacterium]
MAVPPAVAQEQPQAEQPQAEQAPPSGAPAENVKPETVEPSKPMNVPVSVDPNGYKLGPDDVIFIHVWREPDLSTSQSIRPDGKITLPVIKEIMAAGLTPTQLGAEISKALSDYVKNPQVVVAVQAVRSKRYYLSGEVNRPGAYPLAQRVTVFEALTMAGGFREFAGKKKIVVIRGTQRFKFNWNEVVKGKNLAQNIPLENGDHIIVP